MEILTAEELILYKKLERNRKAREAYELATREGRNKKLVNILGPSKRGRKNKQNKDSLIIDEVKEPTKTEKILNAIKEQNRKNQYIKRIK
jgi:hypothetical protein